MKEFVLHVKQTMALALVLLHNVVAYVGGIRSGKTIVGAHYALECIIKRPTETGGIFSNTNKQLTKATLKEFKGVLASYGLHEGVDYVVNKNPERVFGYKSKFTDHAGIWSFWNGAQVFTFSLETQIRGVEFGWVWGDEVQDADINDLYVVMGRMSGSDNAKTLYTMTPPKSNPDIDEMIYGDNHLPAVFGTTYDNSRNLPAGYIEDLEMRYDKYTFKREVLCERVTLAGLNWLYSFDKTVHVSTNAAYHPSKHVFISLDFNANPFACTLSHRGTTNGKRWVHYFDTIVISPDRIKGREYIQAMADEVKLRIPTQAKTFNYSLTGDASGHAKSVLLRSGVVTWSRVIECFGCSMSQLYVPKHNPLHTESRTLVNSIFASPVFEVLMHPQCKELIRDCEWVMADNKGGIIKQDRNDIMQQADLFDAMRYDLHTFDGDFIEIR